MHGASLQEGRDSVTATKLLGHDAMPPNTVVFKACVERRARLPLDHMYDEDLSVTGRHAASVRWGLDHLPTSSECASPPAAQQDRQSARPWHAAACEQHAGRVSVPARLHACREQVPDAARCWQVESGRAAGLWPALRARSAAGAGHVQRHGVGRYGLDVQDQPAGGAVRERAERHKTRQLHLSSQPG